MSEPTNSMAPATCRRRIAEVRRRWALLRRGLAVSLLAGALLVSGAVIVGLDAWYRGGAGSRVVLLAMWLTSATLAARRWVLPLLPGLDRDGAAMCLERDEPSLGGRLITAVQLETSGARDRSGTSMSLYEAVLATAERDAASLDPRRTIPVKPYVWPLASAWGAIVLIVLSVAMRPALASIGVRRVLMPWGAIAWPHRTLITLDALPDGGKLLVARGGTLELSGSVSGVVPAGGTLRLQAGDAPADRIRFEIPDGGRFAVAYRPVTGDLRAWFEIGDAVTEPLAVEMVPPPEIAAVEARLDYPAYTRLEAQTVPDGNLRAPLGTRVRLEVSASKPLASAVMAWDRGESVALRLDDPKRAAAEFEVVSSGGFRVHLTDTLGFVNRDPVAYQVEMVDNLYPRIERTFPSGDKRISPKAVIPLAVEATDDYGVAEAILCWRLGDTGEIQRVTIPVAEPRRRLEPSLDWAIEPLQLAPETTVQFWIEVRDEGPHGREEPWPVSRSRTLTIVEEGELANALAEAIDQTLERLAQLQARQAECADAVARAARDVNEDGTTDAEIRRLQAERYRQEQIARGGAQLGERLASIAEDFAISRIGEPERVERLRQTAARLNRTVGVDMPQVVMSLEAAAARLKPDASEPPATTQEER